MKKKGKKFIYSFVKKFNLFKKHSFQIVRIEKRRVGVVAWECFRPSLERRLLKEINP